MLTAGLYSQGTLDFWLITFIGVETPILYRWASTARVVACSASAGKPRQTCHAVP